MAFGGATVRGAWKIHWPSRMLMWGRSRDQTPHQPPFHLVSYSLTLRIRTWPTFKQSSNDQQKQHCHQVLLSLLETLPIMSTEAADQPVDLTKVDSAVSGLSSSPTEEKKMGHRRTSSSVPGVYNINDLGEDFLLITPATAVWLASTR